jgi:DNA-directed RNA polymerase specialized sigma24 family protein
MAVHHDRTIEYDKEIQMIARRLCNGDRSLAQDLRSEMYIAILSLEAGQDKALCLRVAKCRAIDYLRSRARNYSYGGVIKHMSLDAMEEAGFQIDTEGNVYEPENHSSIFVEDVDNS